MTGKIGRKKVLKFRDFPTCQRGDVFFVAGNVLGMDVACVPNFRDRECDDHDTVVRHRDDGRLTSLADGLANAPGVAGLPLFLQWIYRRVCGAGSGPASVECLESHE